MRFDKDGKLITLEQDIQEIWSSHGLEVLEETVPAHPDNPVTTWIIKAKPKEGLLEKHE